MHEAHPTASSSLPAMQAFAERIEQHTPHLQVVGVDTSSRPFVTVRDSVHDIVVGFSSEADYLTYIQVVGRMQGRSHHAS